MYRRGTYRLVQATLVVCVWLAGSSQVAAQPEACGDGGGGSNDIAALSAQYVAADQQIVVRMRLCSAPDAQSKYRLRFDTGPNLVEWPAGSGTFVSATLSDGNPSCLTTDDTGVMLHRGRANGPGTIAVSDDVITFRVPLAALSPAVPLGGRVRYRVDVQDKGIVDQAPNVDARDGCSKPQSIQEVQGLYLIGLDEVIGTQQFDILRSTTRTSESAMGNLVADAMRAVTGAEAALTNAGGLRADLICSATPSGEPPCAITFGEATTVLPFGNTAALVTLTAAQLEAALLNGVAPACGPGIPTGRFPVVSGIRFDYTCAGTTPVIIGIWKTPAGIGGPATPLDPADTIRVVTNNFMMGGGDGYTVLASGSDVSYPDRELLSVFVEYLGTASPVAPRVEGRIVKQ